MDKVNDHCVHRWHLLPICCRWVLLKMNETEVLRMSRRVCMNMLWVCKVSSASKSWHSFPWHILCTACLQQESRPATTHVALLVMCVHAHRLQCTARCGLRSCCAACGGRRADSMPGRRYESFTLESAQCHISKRSHITVLPMLLLSPSRCPLHLLLCLRRLRLSLLILFFFHCRATATSDECSAEQCCGTCGNRQSAVCGRTVRAACSVPNEDKRHRLVASS